MKLTGGAKVGPAGLSWRFPLSPFGAPVLKPHLRSWEWVILLESLESRSASLRLLYLSWRKSTRRPPINCTTEVLTKLLWGTWTRASLSCSLQASSSPGRESLKRNVLFYSTRTGHNRKKSGSFSQKSKFSGMQNYPSSNENSEKEIKKKKAAMQKGKLERIENDPSLEEHGRQLLSVVRRKKSIFNQIQLVFMSFNIISRFSCPSI